jgi:hypothetical protein
MPTPWNSTPYSVKLRVGFALPFTQSSTLADQKAPNAIALPPRLTRSPKPPLVWLQGFPGSPAVPWMF